MEKTEKQPPTEREIIGGLSLVVVSLIYYLARGAERDNLIAWMEEQGQEFAQDSNLAVAPVDFYQQFVATIRKGRLSDLTEMARPPEQGPH